MKYSTGIRQIKDYCSIEPKKGLILLACSTIISGCSSMQHSGSNADCVGSTTPEFTNTQASVATPPPSPAPKSPVNAIDKNTTIAKQSAQIAESPAIKKPHVSQSAARAASNVVRPAAALEKSVAAKSNSATATFKKLEKLGAKPKTDNDNGTRVADTGLAPSNKKVLQALSSKPAKATKATESSITESAQNLVSAITTATSAMISGGSASQASSPVVAVEKQNVVAVASAPVVNSIEAVNKLTESTPTAAGPQTESVPLRQGEDKPVEKSTQPPQLAVKKPASRSATVINRPSKGQFGIWKVEENWDGKHPGVCRLSTPTRQIGQPEFTAQLWLSVIDDQLLVNTTTNIDIKQPGVGIKTNNGALQRFSKNVYADSAVWSGNLSKTLKTSKEMKIVVGGREVGKKKLVTSINLKDLKKAYSAYNQCNG